MDVWATGVLPYISNRERAHGAAGLLCRAWFLGAFLIVEEDVLRLGSLLCERAGGFGRMAKNAWPARPGRKRPRRVTEMALADDQEGGAVIVGYNGCGVGLVPGRVPHNEAASTWTWLTNGLSAMTIGNWSRRRWHRNTRMT